MNFTVSCQNTSFDLGVEDVAGLSDPCDGVSCGSMGTCMPLNGSPTCVCGPGYAAVNIGGSLTCALVQETYLANQLLWPEWPPVVELGDDDDTVSSDDDDTVSSDDDDTVSSDDDDAGIGNQPGDYQGLDSSISCACQTAGSGEQGMLALAMLGLLGLGLRRRRLS